MNKTLLSVLGLLFLFLLLFLVHYVLLPFLGQVSQEFLSFVYLYNLLSCVLVIQVLYGISLYSKEFLGFIYLLVIPIKLLLFFYWINNKDFELDRSAYLHFFIPYGMGLFTELYLIIKLLNQDKPNKSN